MRTFALLLFAFALPSSTYAQATMGAITGVVKDTSGAVVPNASIRVTNEATGTAETVQTQSDGVYISPPLQPGRYKIGASAAGFKQVEVPGLTVNVGTTLTQDLVLEVGLVTETVHVAGQSTLVETASGNVGTTVQVSF